MNNQILLPTGISIGHASNTITGVTVILAPEGAVAGVDVRGCAPGTRETDVLHNEKAMEKINAIVLTGGSAYGLESACGVMKFLREREKGYKMGTRVVPIVSAAVIYDLNNEDYNFPDIAMGYEACLQAKNTDINFGKVGVGTGATVGKIRGLEHADEGGIGGSTVCLNGLFVTAVVACNASGDVYDHNTNKIIAGAHDNSGGFLDTRSTILSGNFSRLMYGTNTTIGAVITNAKLSKVQANKLATISQNGLAQSIKPVHTDYDGDTIFALASGEVECDFNMLSIMAVEAVSRAITASVIL